MNSDYKIIVVLPDIEYYLWQMLVQMYNFKKYGLEEKTIFLIGKLGDNVSKPLENILKNNNTKFTFSILKDERVNLRYPSTLRPNLLKRYLKLNPIEKYLYIDPDVLFTKKPKFNNLLDNETQYLSDTKSYISSKYVKSCSVELFHKMCDITSVKPLDIENIDNNAGGAQYFLKNIGHVFWEKVERDSENLYILMEEENKVLTTKIQSWTADMWAVLWNLVYFKKNIKISDELSFSWATDTIDKWDNNLFFHNAGLVKKNSKYFSKIEYQKSPFYENFDNIDKNNITYKYVKEIIKTKYVYNNLIF